MLQYGVFIVILSIILKSIMLNAKSKETRYEKIIYILLAMFVSMAEMHAIADGGNSGIKNVNEVTNHLRFNGKELTFDTAECRYYATLPSKLLGGGDYAVKVDYSLKNGFGGLTLKIDNVAVGADSVTVLKDVTCARTYQMTLADSAGDVRAEASVQFTFMPIVEVRVDSSCNSETFTTGAWRVICADDAGPDTAVIAAFRHRGNFAQYFPKKSYAVKLRDEEGESVDRSYFGLRSDNNWILDAMAADMTCMRNRVATDLWNEFAERPYYFSKEKKALTGTRGRMVEVFLNGRYNGIYCMTEKLDRKQLKLKKYKEEKKDDDKKDKDEDKKDGDKKRKEKEEDDEVGKGEVHGLLYKPADWCYEVLMGHEPYQQTFPRLTPCGFGNTLGVEGWTSFEQKYPDYEEEAVEWTPLWNAVNFVATSTDEDFEENVGKYFDMPVVNDYYLFIDLLLATDNHGKNIYYFVYDRKGANGDLISLAPWDLDGVFGARWSGSVEVTKDFTLDLDDYLWNYESGQHTLFYRLMKSPNLKWKETLASRYAKLRGTVINGDSLAQRFATYANVFVKSGADKREEARWNSGVWQHSEIVHAVEYCENWVKGRITALDQKYGYSTGGVSDVKADFGVTVKGGRQSIVINSRDGRRVNVYGMQGTLVRSVQINAGSTVIDGIAPGMYVVEHQKVVVR